VSVIQQIPLIPPYFCLYLICGVCLYIVVVIPEADLLMLFWWTSHDGSEVVTKSWWQILHFRHKSCTVQNKRHTGW